MGLIGNCLRVHGGRRAATAVASAVAGRRWRGRDAPGVVDARRSDGRRGRDGGREGAGGYRRSLGLGGSGRSSQNGSLRPSTQAVGGLTERPLGSEIKKRNFGLRRPALSASAKGLGNVTAEGYVRPGIQLRSVPKCRRPRLYQRQ